MAKRALALPVAQIYQPDGEAPHYSFGKTPLTRLLAILLDSKLVEQATQLLEVRQDCDRRGCCLKRQNIGQVVMDGLTHPKQKSKSADQ